MFRLRLAMLPLVFLLTGCPLESKYSLSENHSARMDQRLLGKWVDASSDNSAKGVLSIYRFNENEYYIEAMDLDTNKIDRYGGFLTLIDNVPILNVHEVYDNVTPIDYMYIKIALSADDKLTFFIIQDSLLAGRYVSSRNDLLYYIRTNINNSKLYDNVITLRRKVY